MAIFNPETKKFYCECGCGTQIPFCNSYVFGHQSGTPEARKRASEIGKVTVKTMQTPEARRKARQSMQRNWDSLTSEERKTRMEISVGSEAAKIARLETFRTPKYRARLRRINSRSMKQFWEDLTLKEKAEVIRNNPWFHSLESNQSPNKTEIQLQKFLEQSFPGLFTPDWIERADIGGRHPDFYTKDGLKLVVESNGDCWHEDWGEEEQVAHYKEYGFNCIIVWASSKWDIIYEWPKLATRIREALVK